MIKWLIVILTLAGLLRIVGLNKIPPELFGDEIDVGYQAYSLLKTGRDIYNQPIPTYIRSLAEPRAPLLMYAIIPTIATAGLNEWGVRLTPAIFGVLGILALFILTYTLTKSSVIALMSMTILTIMPWHIHYSRAGFEVTLMLTLITLATALFLRKRQVLSYIFFALTVYTYSTAVLFVPLLILALWVFTKPKIISWGLLIFIVLLLPFGYQTLRGQTGKRFSTISIASNPEIAQNLTRYRAYNNSVGGKFLYNRYTELTRLFVTNYVEAFSSDFLFVRGDPDYRHSYQFTGELFSVFILLLIPGIIYLANRRQWLILVWLLLAPVSSALTFDGGNHATRLFLMTVPLAIIVGSGAFWIFSKSKIALVGVFIIWLYTFCQAGFYYAKIYPIESWRWWGVGYKDSMQNVANLAGDYSRVFINNTYEPALMRFLFWTKYDPAKFHKVFIIDQSQENIVSGYDGFSLDGKYFFGAFNDNARVNGISNLLMPNSLYLISQRDDVSGDWDWQKTPPAGVSVKSVINNPYGQRLFYLVSKK